MMDSDGNLLSAEALDTAENAVGIGYSRTGGSARAEQVAKKVAALLFQLAEHAEARMLVEAVLSSVQARCGAGSFPLIQAQARPNSAC